MSNHVNAVNAAYAKIVQVLLELKANGTTSNQLVDAIARAAWEVGVRIK